jgi:hypothetical protein
MIDRRSSAPPFTLGAVEWHCWVTADNRYAWRSACGRYVAWREGRFCRARRGDQVSEHLFHDLYDAMRAAQFGRSRRAAA